jgi:hypothetical protein
VLGQLLALAALTCRARSLATLACAPDLGGRRWKPIISPQLFLSFLRALVRVRTVFPDEETISTF